MSEPCTVVVASRNRPEHLRACVAALLALDYPDVSIIVVDDGSEPPLAPLLRDLGPTVTVIRQENAGPAAARNRGVEAASTDFIAFTDDDCRPARDWLRRLADARGADAQALVGGQVRNDLPGNAFSEASQCIAEFLYRWFERESDRLRFFSTNNVAFSRAVFRDVGMLDPYFVFASEDRDLGLRWRERGYALIYAEDAIVGHRHRLGTLGFWRQHMRYGRGAFRLRAKRGENDGRLALEPIRFYAGLVTHPFARGGSVLGAFLLSGLVLVSQAALVHGYLAERIASRRAPEPRAGGRGAAAHAPVRGSAMGRQR